MTDILNSSSNESSSDSDGEEKTPKQTSFSNSDEDKRDTSPCDSSSTSSIVDCPIVEEEVSSMKKVNITLFYLQITGN